MNKTKITLSIIIAITIMMPIVLAQTSPPSLLPDFTEIGKSLVKIFTNRDYDRSTMETIIRIALLIISTAVIHRILNYTFGEEGTAKAGILTDKLILLISTVSGLVIALLTPPVFIINGIVVILSGLLAYFALEGLWLAWKETTNDEEKWATLIKLSVLTATLTAFHILILSRIQTLPTSYLPTDAGSINALIQISVYVVFTLLAITIISIIIFFYNRGTPAKTKTEKAKEGLTKEEEKTQVARIGLKKAAQAKIIEAINNTKTLIAALEALQNAYSVNTNKVVNALQKMITSYFHYYAKFTKTEDELNDLKQAEIKTSKILPATKKIIANAESLLTFVKTTHIELSKQLQKRITSIDAGEGINLEEARAEKGDIANITKLIQLLMAVLKINQEEAEEK